MGPARMFAESLTPRPGIREHNLPQPDLCNAAYGLNGSDKLLDHLVRGGQQGGRTVRPSVVAVKANSNLRLLHRDKGINGANRCCFSMGLLHG